MSRRRSQRPPKARNSAAPDRVLPASEKVTDRVEAPLQEPPATAPLDELAALDAGWDELS